MTASAGNSIRYERKFFLADTHPTEAEKIIRLHPALFREIFHERTVNNIYFDTPGLDFYFDNVEGEKKRRKVRIRWYGKLFGEAKNPMLELKEKEGLCGYKRSYPLQSLVINTNMDIHLLHTVFQKSELHPSVYHYMLSLNPLLLNTYRRKYYISSDGLFRLTLDYRLVFYRLQRRTNIFLNCSHDHNNCIIEIKYEPYNDFKARNISSNFPFRLSKSSKYLQGLERIYA